MWVFFRAPSTRWRWQYRNGMGLVAIQSNDDFATVHDAEVDARLYGYGLEAAWSQKQKTDTMNRIFQD
jgi:hypothetical protein